MTNKKIDVRVQGSANFADLLSQTERAEARARKLRDAYKQAGGEVGQLSRMSGMLDKLGLGQQGLRQRFKDLTSIAGGSLSAGAMYGRISGGLNAYKQHLQALDEEARTVKQLGRDYREYHKAVIETGKAYGYQNSEIVALQSQQARMLGRRGIGQLEGDMRTIQGFGRSYGMGAVEAGGYFEQAGRAGITSGTEAEMSPKQYATLIADAVVAGQMQGREGELIGSIQRLSAAVSSQSVTSKGTGVAASALATLNATGNQRLQGEAGAGLLERLNSAIMNPGGGEAGDLFMYRALSGSKGDMSIADYRYLQEGGLGGVGPTGKSNLQAVMEAVGGMQLPGRYRLMAASQLSGLSMRQYEGVEQAFMKDGQFQSAKLGNLQKRLGEGGLKSVDASVWPLLAELTNGGDEGAIRREFEQLSGKKATSTNRDGLFQEISGYGKENVALAEGQQRAKLDADIEKAAEAAASKLYEVDKAAAQFTKTLIETTGALPGPAGGIAPIVAAGAAGSLLGRGSGWAAGKLFGGLGKIAGLGGAAAGTGAAGTSAAAGGLGVGALAAGAAAGLGTAAGAGYLGKRYLGTAGLGVVPDNLQRGIGALGTGEGWAGLGKAGAQIGASSLATAGSVGSLPVTASKYIAQGMTPTDAIKRAYQEMFWWLMPDSLKFGKQPTGRGGNSSGGWGGGGGGSSSSRPRIASSAGGWWNVPKDEQPAYLHRDEMVLPAHLADPLRKLIEQQRMTGDQMRAGAVEVRVKIDPITVQLPGGQRQQVGARATSSSPFQGVQSYPTRGAR